MYAFPSSKGRSCMCCKNKSLAICGGWLPNHQRRPRRCCENRWSAGLDINSFDDQLTVRQKDDHDVFAYGYPTEDNVPKVIDLLTQQGCFGSIAIFAAYCRVEASHRSCKGLYALCEVGDAADQQVFAAAGT